jgi:sugar lactone lactonase YvrE
MANREVTTLVDGGSFFEGPRWHDGRWYVSDFYRHTVFAITPDGRQEPIAEVPGQPSGLGWMPDGSMLIVSMKDNRLLRRAPDGTLDVHADLAEHSQGMSNDMVVDVEGRAYVGSFGFDLMSGADPRPSSVVCVDPNGRVTKAADDLLFPNGSVITADGSTLIVGESFGCRFTAFTIGTGGELTDRRVWAQLGATPDFAAGLEQVIAQATFAPDGCALDADGCIWVADALGGRAARVAEGGEIRDEVRPPDGLHVFACMLGGDDGRTLLLCCAPTFAEHERVDATDAVLLTTTVDAPHAGLP